jgi:hypothetical protein
MEIVSLFMTDEVYDMLVTQTTGRVSDMSRYGLIESPFPLERDIQCRPYSHPVGLLTHHRPRRVITAVMLGKGTLKMMVAMETNRRVGFWPMTSQLGAVRAKEEIQ